MKFDNLLAGYSNDTEIKTFKHFFEEFYPLVCMFAVRYLDDRYLSEDFAQEAFIEFWKKKDEFVDSKAAKGFIYTVARNKCLNHLKTKDIHDSILKNKLATDDYFYELIIEEETYSILYQAINNLAPQSKNVIMLSLEGKRNQEIANILDVSINTVKTLKKIAYKELRHQLKGHVTLLLILYLFWNNFQS